MDPVIGSALISAGGSLLGGLFGKKKEKYVVPDYQQIRDKAEAAGFNPLTALTQGPQGSVVQTGGQMGQAISDAALLMADGLKGREEDKLRLENLRMQNDKLKKELTDATIRPKIGGVYAQREKIGETDPILSLGFGARGGAGTSSSPSGNGALDRVEPLYIDVFDKKTGRTVTIPNPDLMDMDLGSLSASSAMIGGLDLVQNGVGPTAKGWGQSIKEALHKDNLDRQAAREKRRIEAQTAKRLKYGFQFPPVPPPRKSKNGSQTFDFWDRRYSNPAW